MKPSSQSASTTSVVEKPSSTPHQTLRIKSRKPEDKSTQNTSQSQTDYWAEHFKGTEVEGQAREAVRAYASLPLEQARNSGLTLAHDNVMMSNAIEDMRVEIIEQGEKIEDLEERNLVLTDQRDYLRDRIGVSTPELDAMFQAKIKPKRRSREDKQELFDRIMKARRNAIYLMKP